MSFSKEEKKDFAFKKYLREHLFDFALDIISKIVSRIRYYRKEYIDVDIK